MDSESGKPSDRAAAEKESGRETQNRSNKGYRIPGEEMEACDCITIMWKKDAGLIGYESSRTSAGEDLIQIWNGKFARVEDGRLVIH